MTNMKKGLSLLLCLVMLLSTVPVTRAQAANESDASVDSGAVTVAGTNSVGNLLSRELQAYQEADEAAGGYNVVGLTVENSIATAQFRTLEPAILVVALYTEDGLQLVTSGKAEVQPEETEISIVLENVPEYFTAKAYLVDTYDFSPLCTAYESVMYTQEMQELLASTVDDYDPALVLNMDSSTNTNFAVYDDTVILLGESEGTNTVVSVDDEKAEYIIDNIDSRIKSLSAGNVFALTYGDGEIIIAKVASISITGTTATIIGDDVDLEEVFSHIKISGACTSDDVENAENLSTEEVSFEGIETEHSTKANNGNDKFLKFHIRATEKDGATSVVVDAVVKLNIDVIFDYYVTLKKQHLEFKINKAVEASISVTGRLTKTVDLTKVPLEFSPVAGVYIRLQPQMIFRVSAKKSSDDRIVLKAASTEGFSFENGKGFKNLGTTPLVDVDLGETDYSFFVGVDLRPSVVVLTKKFISLEFSAVLGFDIQPEQTGCAYVNNTTDIKHACENCINIEVFFKFTFAIKLKFLDSDRLSFSYFLLEPSPIKLLNMYWSLTQSKFGFGECPYKQYKIQLMLKLPMEQF